MPMGRAVRDILNAIGIAHVTAESAEQVAAAVRQAGTNAFNSRVSCACLLPKLLTAGELPRRQTAEMTVESGRRQP